MPVRAGNPSAQPIVGGLTALYVVLCVALDQSLKYAVVAHLHQGQSIPVIAGVFHLTLVYNTGAAFGLFGRQSTVLIAVAAAAIMALLWLLARPPRFSAEKYTRVWSVALTLVLSGAVGNLIDRLRYGYVIDFLDFRIWPVFNAADVFITGGAALLLYVSTIKDVLSGADEQRSLL